MTTAAAPRTAAPTAAFPDTESEDLNLTVSSMDDEMGITEELPGMDGDKLDITKMPQGFVGVADEKLSNYVNAFTLFSLAVTFQARVKGDEGEEHDPKFILPGTYRTLIDNAKQLKGMIPHIKSAKDVSRIRGKALQFLYIERNFPALLDAAGNEQLNDRGQVKKQAFIAKYLTKANQGRFMTALRYAVKDVVDACDANVKKDVIGAQTPAPAAAAPATTPAQ